MCVWAVRLGTPPPAAAGVVVSCQQQLPRIHRRLALQHPAEPSPLLPPPRRAWAHNGSHPSSCSQYLVVENKGGGWGGGRQIARVQRTHCLRELSPLGEPLAAAAAAQEKRRDASSTSTHMLVQANGECISGHDELLAVINNCQHTSTL